MAQKGLKPLDQHGTPTTFRSADAAPILPQYGFPVSLPERLALLMYIITSLYSSDGRLFFVLNSADNAQVFFFSFAEINNCSNFANANM